LIVEPRRFTSPSTKVKYLKLHICCVQVSGFFIYLYDLFLPFFIFYDFLPSYVRASEIIMSEPIVKVTDDNFEQEVLKADLPVLVDYWAEWCGPCKMIAPVLDAIAREYKGKLKVAKLNIDENPTTPPKYGIRGIPTLLLFKDGEVEATKVGAISKPQLTAFIDSQL